MRIGIREQLASLVLFCVLFSLAVLSIPTWIYVRNFVNGVESDGLALAASLKAAQISSQIELIQTVASSIAGRLLIQRTLESYYLGNVTKASWDQAKVDLLSGLNSGSSVTGSANLLQAQLFSRNESGNSISLMNVTAPDLDIRLPGKNPDGSDLYLADTSLGYPRGLYPNITYEPSNNSDPLQPGKTVPNARPFPEVKIDNSVGGLVFGPLMINETYLLLSLTIPIRKNSNADVVLGYMTLVAEGKTIIQIAQSQEGLGSTGSLLLVGPNTGWNRFNKYNFPTNLTHTAATNFSSVDVQFVLPPLTPPGTADRHSERTFASDREGDSFTTGQYPAVFQSLTIKNSAPNNASSMLSTTNEQNVKVAVGFARPQTGLVNWTLIIEQTADEAHAPIADLRKIILGCVFGTAGLIFILVLPCAHYSVRPIRQLKLATEQSTTPPGYEGIEDEDLGCDQDHPSSLGTSGRDEKGLLAALKRRMKRHRRAISTHSSDERRRRFKIPAKVPSKTHTVDDELTELTVVYNEMCDELLSSYTQLDLKVAERTRELEISKKAAEAANESKTLFIANLSHELKTPLNAILGISAVCMEEDEIGRIKQSLKTLYKSGDLLLHLLEDLLSFSKNQIGQQLSLDEKEFRLGDIRSQVLAIFDKQVRDRQINYSVRFLNTEPGSPWLPSVTGLSNLPAMGPPGTGRVKDMVLWGDQHRILQVLINLVSNSLKFTPEEGSVSVRIRCVEEIEQSPVISRASSTSRTSNRTRVKHRVSSGSANSVLSNSKTGTALLINPADFKAGPQANIRDQPATPPQNSKLFMFEFEVEDTGPGIPVDMQQRVFEPFVQGDLGLSKKYGGTGLGLSICQQLAHLMGGFIKLKSTVGVGATFTMQIPLRYTDERPSSVASESAKSRPTSIVSMSPVDDVTRRSSVKNSPEVKATVLDNQQPRLVGLSQPFFTAKTMTKSQISAEEQMSAIDRALANKPDSKLRVLVAEDNSTNVEVVKRMLKLEEVYDVTIAKDGQEAYELVKANMERNLRFDLIFMDIQMPNLDGLQSTRMIRKMGYSAPIVALSAFSDQSNVQECMESGMDEFLAKPIRRPALKQVLKRFATIVEEPETNSVMQITPERAVIENAASEPTKPPDSPLASHGHVHEPGHK